MLKINRTQEPNILQQNINCFSPKNYIILKEALIKDLNDRCSYCGEENISTATGEIDHFLPKKNFPTKKCEWTNLFWSCKKCNGHKLNKFFSEDENKNIGKLEYEPLKFDDKNYKFAENFSMDTFTGEIMFLNKRAETTINMLNLNNPFRNKARKKILIEYEKSKNIKLSKYKTLIEYYYSIN